MSTRHNFKRGIVKVKPVYLGVHHYRDVERSGSVGILEVGRPPVPPLKTEDLQKRVQNMVDEFKKNLEVNFVEVEQPFIVKELSNLWKLPAELSYDVDALLVRSYGTLPIDMEVYSLQQYELPVIRDRVSSDFLRALRVKKFLKQSKILYIGEFPSFSISNLPYDLLPIQKRFGVQVRHIETNEFYRWFDRCKEEEVKKELTNWKKCFDKVVGPSEQDLMDATRIYLTLRYLCKREGANALTVNCGRFTEERSYVPCLAFDRLIDEGIMCGCEGDLTATLSALMLHAISGRAILMGNFGATPGHFGARSGEVAINHCHISLSMAKTGYTIRDYHGRKFGVTGYAEIKAPQSMTILNLDSSLSKISVLEGTVKGSEDGIISAKGKEGVQDLCRVLVRMSINGDTSKVPQVIVGSQHASMIFGHWLSAFQELGKLLQLEVHHL